jgi:hypothetical protein
LTRVFGVGRDIIIVMPETGAIYKFEVIVDSDPGIVAKDLDEPPHREDKHDLPTVRSLDARPFCSFANGAILIIPFTLG